MMSNKSQQLLDEMPWNFVTFMVSKKTEDAKMKKKDESTDLLYL